MTAIIEFLQSEIAADLSIALLHTLWQGLLVTALLYLALKALPSSCSRWRYRLCIVSLFAVVLFMPVTFSLLQHETPPVSTNTSTKANSPVAAEMSLPAENTAAVIAADRTASISDLANNTTGTEPVKIGFGWFIVLWASGVTLMLVRIFRAFTGTAKLRSDSVDIEDPSLKELFDKLCGQMNLTGKIRFAASKILKNPGVIGFFKPVLLVPVSMLSELPADYLEAIIAHELAHIRRYDYLVNFCQMLIEAVFFFNPAVWWISRQTRIEREVCCDFAGIQTTGKRIEYAKILFDQLTRASNAAGPAMTAAITGFSDEATSNSAERVKRIIHPQHKPQMRIGWAKLALLVVIASAAMLALWKTTDATVSIAAKILTPKERIEKMAEIEKSHGLPEYDPDNSDIKEDEKVTVSGTIKTWDGKKVGRNANMAIHYARPKCSGTIGISPSYGEGTWDGSAGTFSHRCSYGTIYVSATSMNYAPAIAGPFKIGPGEKKEDIELFLEKGAPATIRIIDADSQKPVSNVELIGGYLMRPDGYTHNINLTTDDKGLAVLEHAGDFNLTLMARTKGYQEKRFEDQALVKNGTVTLMMKKANLVEGVVVSKKTGQPIANATIRIQQTATNKPSTRNWGRDEGKVLATTDENGRFVLNELSEEVEYVLCIKAENYAYEFTDQISSGSKDVRIELDEPLVIKGRVTGPLDRVPDKDGKPYVPYICTFSWNHHSQSEMSQKAFVTINGNEGTFELTDLWGTRVTVGLNYPTGKKISLDEDIPAEIAIDLSDPLTENGKKYYKRELVLEFVTPKGFPPPTGTVGINYTDPARSNFALYKIIKIEDGNAGTDIIAPGKIGYRLADTIGYWFKEKSGIIVDDKKEPLVIKVPAIPAGMIFGEVLDTDGSPIGSTMVSYNTIKKSPLLDKNTGFLGVEGKNSSSSAESETKYAISPLPLEGEYRVIAYHNDTYVISETVKLTSKDPIKNINLKFPKGVTLSGRILLPDGTPANNINYKLDFETAAGKGFTYQGNYTDHQGRFSITQVNPDTGGKYHLIIESNKDYRPVKMEIKNLKKPIEVKLEKGAVATGIVIDKETGWPIPSVTVRAYYYKKNNHENVTAESVTDKNGRFRFSNLKNGIEYRLTVESCKYGSYTIIGGKTKDGIFEVTPYEWSDLKPRKPDSNN